jgi:hypothetical protein
MKIINNEERKRGTALAMNWTPATMYFGANDFRLPVEGKQG